MPKKWKNNWEPCENEELEKKRDSQLLTLGNLAIIPQSLNASIRDAAWKTKRTGKGDNKPGLDRCAKGLCTLQEALEKEDWNECEIETRAEWLFDNARAIWSL